MKQGLMLCAIQVLLALSVGGKFLYDRLTLPRAWARTAPVDPSAPIRGRYVRISVEVEPQQPLPIDSGYVALSASAGRLVAAPAREGLRVIHGRDDRWVLAEPLAFFIPEKVADPSVRAQGEELWVEVSVPEKGPPRPLRLGVKRGGTLAPLELK